VLPTNWTISASPWCLVVWSPPFENREGWGNRASSPRAQHIPSEGMTERVTPVRASTGFFAVRTWAEQGAPNWRPATTAGVVASMAYSCTWVGLSAYNTSSAARSGDHCLPPTVHIVTVQVGKRTTVRLAFRIFCASEKTICERIPRVAFKQS
jgi:hypothetical protein